MYNLLIYAIVIALLSAFVILFANKIGLIEYLVNIPNKFISKLGQCNFCMSFWIALFISIIIIVLTKDLKYIFIPIISSPISRLVI